MQNDPSQIADLQSRAEAGDADAQYRLAAALSGAGKRGEAGVWLEKAAGQGHGDALYTLATRNLRSETIDAALAFLTRAEAAGSVPAIRLAAVLYAGGYGVARDWGAAAARIIALARAGEPSAMREAAMALLLGDPDDEDGAALISAAAGRDALAGVVAVRRAALGRRFSDSQEAQRVLAMLERAGYPEAASLKAALAAAPSGEARETPSLDWDRAAQCLEQAPASAAVAAETLCVRPAARVYRGVFPPEACDYVIAAAARFAAPSMVTDPQTGMAMRDAYRTSMTAIMAPANIDIALVAIAHRMAALADRPAENGESLSVLLYGPGQEYRAHCDWLPPGPELDRGGQRATTALFYLNDAYEGGETQFMLPGITFKGAAGDLLVFENVLENGDPDPDSRHAGLPVRSGRKWLASLWLREKSFRF